MMRQRLQHTFAILVAASTAAMQPLAFSNMPKIRTRQNPTGIPPSRSRATPKSYSSSSTQMRMFVDGQEELLTPFTGSSHTFGALTMPFLMGSTPTGATLITNPNVEAEVLNDMSHVALDMMTFFGPATAALRLFAVIGRLLAVSADYLPDHSIHGEELVFQMLMLGVASRALYKSALPVIASTWSTPSMRDGRTYQTLFGPMGMSWAQYKAMLAVAMDWIEVDSDTIVSTNERQEYTSNRSEDQYMYWVYSGDVKVTSQGKTLQTISRKTSSPRPDEPPCVALLGDMEFVRSLDERNRKHNKFDRISKRTQGNKISLLPKTTITTGKSGATLLRINTSKLLSLMENDEQLGQAIQRLLVTEMQEKLSAMLAKNPDSNHTAMSFA